MDEKLERGIVDLLKAQGYNNVTSNFGMICYEDKDGTTWSISATLEG